MWFMYVGSLGGSVTASLGSKTPGLAGGLAGRLSGYPHLWVLSFLGEWLALQRVCRGRVICSDSSPHKQIMSSPREMG